MLPFSYTFFKDSIHQTEEKVTEAIIRYTEACSGFKEGEEHLKTARKEQDEDNARCGELRMKRGKAKKFLQALDDCPKDLRGVVTLKEFDGKVSEYRSELLAAKERMKKRDEMMEMMATKQREMSERVDSALRKAGTEIHEANALWCVVSEQVKAWRSK